jgi:flagellar basal-body rod modification protein FlgD
MATDATTAAAASNAAAAASSTSSTAVGKARLADSFDTFLTLLTAQMKNQDPLSPMDANQFTAQIVQMTGVEQQLLSNDLLQKLVNNTSGGLDSAVSLIGKQVRAVTSDAALANGKAEWVYKLDSAAADVKIEVLDSTGKVVHVAATADQDAGEHTYSWNGKDMQGNPLPDGTYTLRLTPQDGAGQTITSTIYIDGVVSGVEQADGQSLLTINGSKTPWNTVTSVRQPDQTETADDHSASSTAA